MHAKPGRPLLLGVRWCGEPPARITTYTEALLAALEAVEARGRPIPVHWNLAAQQLEKGGERLERLVQRIAERLRTQGDRVLPAGYAGAYHPLLSAAELERELVWSRENPWGSGLSTRFGRDLPFLLPVYPDLPRERSLGVYSRQGFRGAGVLLAPRAETPAGARPGAAPFRLGFPASPQADPPFRVFACLPLPAVETPNELRAFLRGPLRAGGPEPLFLLLDYAAVTRAQAERGNPPERLFAALRAWLEAPAQRTPLLFLSLEEALGRDAEASGAAAPPPAPEGLPEPPLPWDPPARALLRRVRRHRRRPGEEEEGIRRLLRTLAPGAEEWSAAPSPSRPARALRRTTGRAVTASMTGSAVLAGPDFDAYFRGGQLAGLHGRVSPAVARLPGLPDERQVGAHLRVGGRRLLFQLESCVSFESSSRTGLSAVLAASLPGVGEPFTLAIEYTFDDRGPGLRLDLSLRYPEDLSVKDAASASGLAGASRTTGRSRSAASLLEEVVPLEIPLALLAAGERVETAGLYPDGSAWRCLLPGAREEEAGTRSGPEQAVVLAGSRFLFHRRGEGGREDRLRLEIPAGGPRPPNGPAIGWGETHLVRLRLLPADREGRRALVISPFGSGFPLSAARLAGQREELSLSLRLEPAGSSADSSPL